MLAPPRRDVWIGALVTGLLWKGALEAFSWYLRDLTRLTRVNGSIAVVIVFGIVSGLAAIRDTLIDEMGGFKPTGVTKPIPIPRATSDSRSSESSASTAI